MIDKYELKEKLHNGVVTVVFEKVDGSMRTMQATLQADVLPPQLLNEDGSVAPAKRVTPEGQICVWDMEAAGWRSFRLDSVKSVDGVPVE